MPRPEAAVTDYLLDSANIIAESGWWDRQRRIATREEERREVEAAIHEEEVTPEVTQRRLSITAETLGMALLKDGVDIQELAEFFGDFTKSVDSLSPPPTPTEQDETGVSVETVVRHTMAQREYTDDLLRKTLKTESPQPVLLEKPAETEPEPVAVPVPEVQYASMDEFLTHAPAPGGIFMLEERSWWEPHTGTLESELRAATHEPVVVKVEPEQPLPPMSLVDPEDTTYIIIDQGEFHAGTSGERQGERLQNAFDPEATVVMKPVADRPTVIMPLPKPWQVTEPSVVWPQ